jgi:hypothetical protein
MGDVFKLNLPDGQVWHKWYANLSWYLPAGQSKHAPAIDGLALYFPAPQSTHLLSPTGLKKPIGQLLHV